jgi:predicted amidophosphoribosyltransferase
VGEVLGLLFPERCLVCRLPGACVCLSCRAALPSVTAPICGRCGAPTAWPVRRCSECSGRRLAFATARAAVVYDDAARAIVGAWKERGLRRLATFAADVVAESLRPPAATTITFVPAEPERRLKRGHHPARALAHELAARWEISPADLLTRRPGPRQRGLTRAERRRNVREAFSPRCEAPRTVLLVDDVYTSGATANAAASALRRAGASRVHVVAFARAVRGYSIRASA